MPKKKKVNRNETDELYLLLCRLNGIANSIQLKVLRTGKETLAFHEQGSGNTLKLMALDKLHSRLRRLKIKNRLIKIWEETTRTFPFELESSHGELKPNLDPCGTELLPDDNDNDNDNETETTPEESSPAFDIENPQALLRGYWTIDNKEHRVWECDLVNVTFEACFGQAFLDDVRDKIGEILEVCFPPIPATSS